MNKYHVSLRKKKQRKINAVCAKMREAKERKRVENATPVIDRSQNKHAMSILAKDYRTGQTVIFDLYEGDTIRSYWVREDGEGFWNKQRGLDYISKVLSKRFPRVGRFENA